MRGCIAVIMVFVIAASIDSAEPERKLPAERGKHALEQTAFIRAFWPTHAYDDIWKTWDLKTKPADFPAAFRDRYGLHPAPYPNNDLPMGLRKADYLIGKGIGIDCLTCHGGSIMGKSMIGLGNNSVDIHSLFEDLYQSSGMKVKMPYQFCRVRGTSEAGAFAVHLLGMRSSDLSLKPYHNLGLHDDSVEDVPAWWLLKKKKTMYYVGATDANSVRSIMQFMMSPLTDRKEFEAAEPAFRDIQKYILSIEPPKYPFAIDQAKAKDGEKIFTANCSRCHGTYGEKWTYPNKIIPLAKIGTDRKRYDNIGPDFAAAYNASWFAKEKTDSWFLPGKPIRMTEGYQAPPLDGIWATPPYLHNGSVPTLYHLLKSTSRPKVFTRSYRTNEEDYDKVKIGWKYRESEAADEKASGFERRKIYDTTQPGRSNAGHTFGDDLTEEERWSVIEYLKML